MNAIQRLWRRLRNLDRIEELEFDRDALEIKLEAAVKTEALMRALVRTLRDVNRDLDERIIREEAGR